MKLYCLLKRDVYLLTQQWKRLLLYFCSIFLIDVFMLQYHQYIMFIRGFTGISLQEFLDDKSKIPIQWIWAQIGIALIYMDIVKNDIYQISDCLLPHVKKKAYFWYSKVMAGFIFSIVLSIAFFIEKTMLFLFIPNIKMASGLSVISIMKTVCMQCLGMYALYCVYILVDFIFNEMAGMIVCIFYVVIGLPVDIKIFYCNIFMYQRGGIAVSVLACSIVVLITMFSGGYMINKSDLLKGSVWG